MPDEMNGEPSDPVFEEAAAWLARLQEPGVSAADRARFARWLAHDPARRAVFDEAQRLSAALDAPAKALTADAIVVPFPPRPRPAPSAARPPRRRTVAAAAIAITIAAGIWLRQGGLDDLRSDYVTASGERETVALADGSKILLNTDTAVAIDLAGDRRTVRMFRGEAVFTVSADAARPFTVTTGDGRIQVLGTAFNVRLTSRQTVVSVLRGRVSVTAVGPAAAETKLAAGQSASIGAAGVSPPAAFDRTAVTAWQRGQLVFYRTPLGNVVDELNRYQRGRILILSDRVRDLPVSGVFDARRPTAVIDVIERTLDVKATRLTDHLILLR
jgi:transmembrane sensor